MGIETINTNIDEKRKDLERFYDKVITCKLCKLLYGLDKLIKNGVEIVYTRRKENSICPVCIKKLGKGNHFGLKGIRHKLRDFNLPVRISL